MSEDRQASGSPEVEEAVQRRRVWRGPWRSLLFPLLVVAAIAAAIWWLEYRPDSGSSAGDVRYGPVELSAALMAPGVEVSPKVGGVAPDFLLETLEGGEIRLSDLRGRGVIVNLWATWCGSCRKEMPQFVASYDRYQEEGLEIIAVNVQESRSIIRPLVEDFGIEFPVVLDRRGAVSDQYRITGLPTTCFIDRDGVVREVFEGPFLERLPDAQVQGAIAEDELTRRIEEILE